jgi:hypothetical protein
MGRGMFLEFCLRHIKTSGFMSQDGLCHDRIRSHARGILKPSRHDQCATCVDRSYECETYRDRLHEQQLGLHSFCQIDAYINRYKTVLSEPRPRAERERRFGHVRQIQPPGPDGTTVPRVQREGLIRYERDAASGMSADGLILVTRLPSRHAAVGR